ncbi:MAG: hypothetical protein QG629_925 [Patescibacteria group bacterium]|nr:hypothetical protein [Candidatus Saccharibacteria bacterium]MDQ5963842.1 hypothetical protein [Patescibacteria group bacterium]
MESGTVPNPQTQAYDAQQAQPQVANTTFSQAQPEAMGAPSRQPQPSGDTSLDRGIAAAKSIILQTQNSPFAQARDIAALKAVYLEEKYGITPQA